MYVSPTFKTKKALKESVDAGKPVTVFSPGPFPCRTEGTVAVEGPSFQPHSWYARVLVENGKVIKVMG
jgi:hypothetical protein